MTIHNVTVHITDKSDDADIRTVETRAFGYNKEADLVAALLKDESACPTLSLLARHEGKAVGHILFTRATFKEGTDIPLMYILAPLAVISEYQGMGLGGLLIRTGLENLMLMGCQMVFVLGHAIYYPRHGFIPCAGDKGYPAPYPIPEEHKVCWMMQPLSSQPLNRTGRIQCATALMKPEHWRE
ncbi:N-acetyltransferase [Salmonella enterica subsp. enterica]|uniref:N-acetyltransferase n=2 Tax=Salmonella enterica TaxID=28901 RepID=A0A635WEI0_SALER|nr:N-acetyltransferase [Salmonella enterica subsp. enterica serovar Give]EAA9273519.1 N-acetyltransferase [Salmonella enterica subsp. enterica]EAM8516489.1 N-acetyltransferase [Salmonella enterica]EDQ0929097.1 N-acetyltransferase [Salmonella enterica subsp. enterica serovar Anatum]EDW7342744.1 N-acetyltransferase [Salmonella enterica subsp. enterica serovar London]EEB7118981.1 GNAT family N-acetyltransferase [Salmonella enterica subsp. enterica serovar Rubislaw]ETC67431.1 N-acetyltransferase 